LIGDFSLINQVAIFSSQPDRDFGIAIATMIPIEKPIRIDRDPILI
jgi:hypothetical protein